MLNAAFAAAVLLLQVAPAATPPAAAAPGASVSPVTVKGQKPSVAEDNQVICHSEKVIGSLFPRHYFLVDDPRYVTGQFNAHMATCLLLQADEAVWAGDKSAEGRLKGLITSPIQQIERG